jgi:hypothetical protein
VFGVVLMKVSTKLHHEQVGLHRFAEREVAIWHMRKSLVTLAATDNLTEASSVVDGIHVWSQRLLEAETEIWLGSAGFSGVFDASETEASEPCQVSFDS